MSDHGPDPKFVEHLEWQLRSRLRQQALIPGNPRGESKMVRVMGTIAIVASSMVLGGAGTYAVTRDADGAVVELLTQRISTMLEVAEMRVALMGEMVEEARMHVEQGHASRDLLIEQQLQLSQSEHEVGMLRSHLDEIQHSRREPSDSLAAPMTGGRDFVVERLKLQIALHVQMVESAERRAEHVHLLVTQNAVPASELDGARATVRLAQLEFESLTKRIHRRERFVKGELTAREVELQSMIEQSHAARVMSEEQIKQITARFEVVKALHASGQVSRMELRHIELELHTALAGQRLAELELKLLEARLKTVVE
jgi:hypothetical protein